MSIKNVFITGPIHSGKSTILNKVITEFHGLEIGGFRTLPIYQNDQRNGFFLESLDGVKKCFAHIDMMTNNQFNAYKFDYDIFESFGVQILENALGKSDIILMDEIGLMERKAMKFRKMIIKCLDAPQFVLGVCQERAAWFLKILQAREDTKIFSIQNDNRNSIPDKIIAFIFLSLS